MLPQCHSPPLVFKMKTRGRVWSLLTQHPSSVHIRTTTSLSEVSSHKIFTAEYIEANEPKQLRKVKPFETVPVSNLPKHFHDKLNTAHSNPRSILRLYREYIKTDDYPAYDWLVRCFCQLAHVFGFNSFWSTRDKQVVHKIRAFKCLVYDLIERKSLIKRHYVPRLLYAMAALEYRSWQLLPCLLEHVEENISYWRTPTIANMMLTITLLGLPNHKGPIESSSKDFSKLLFKLISEVQYRISTDSTGDSCTPFDWCSMAFAMMLSDSYEYPTAQESPLPYFLTKACEKLSLVNLEYSGWVQFFLYLILYCTDVEKPENMEAIKRAIPLHIQESLHLRWLKDIILKGQPQGSEEFQLEADKLLHQLREVDALINCSVGRPWDEQHCWFVGHLIRSRNLAIEYDYLLPLGPGQPQTSGWLHCKRRLINKFGYHVVTLHKCLWEHLDDEQKVIEMSKLLSNFPRLTAPIEVKRPEFEEDQNIKYLKHKRPKFNTWPPDKIEI